MELRPSLEAQGGKPVDSLHRRYFYKLATGVVGLGLNVAIQAIIPRGLGPRVYGDFAFLSNFFTQVVSFLDTGTSTGFYIKLSQRPQESGLVVFYGYFMGLVALLLAGLLLVCQTTGVWVHIWPGQTLGAIYLAAVWGLLAWMVKLATMMADAYGLTVQSAWASMYQKVLALALIALLYGLNWLWLTTFFFYHYAIMGFFLVAVALLLKRSGHGVEWRQRLSPARLRAYLREFFNYSHPLFIYALVAMVTGVLDRWLLQVFGGSVEQGFFGLSYQIGALCFLCTGAMTPLLMREFAIAFEARDLALMAHLFRRYIPLLYGVAAYFACFLAVQADKVIYLMGGKNFQAAHLALAIMVFYPIHQTYGQLSGSVFMATGDTTRYRNIGITFMLLSLPLTYVLLAPGRMLGLNAGATGLAVKMVLVQALAVNVQLYFNAKMLNLNFRKYILHQIGTILCLTMAAFLAKYATETIFQQVVWVPGSFFMSGLFYTIIVIIMVYIQPKIIGLSKTELNNIIKRVSWQSV